MVFFKGLSLAVLFFYRVCINDIADGVQSQLYANIQNNKLPWKPHNLARRYKPVMQVGKYLANGIKLTF